MQHSLTFIAFLAAAFAIATAGDNSSGVCTPADQRCAGADGKPFVQFYPCCDPELSCVEKANPSADEWGSYCLKSLDSGKCYATGQRCKGAEGYPYVPHLKCCNDFEECIIDLSLGWGSFCKSTNPGVPTIASNQAASTTFSGASRAPQVSSKAVSSSSLKTMPVNLPASFGQQILDVHNQYRQAVRSTPLKWSAALSSDAATWANILAASPTLQLAHSGTAGQGENLWGGTAGKFSSTEMAQAWADESAYFVPGTFASTTGSGGHVVGHYTQMIWKSTTEIGCAIASGSGNDYLVCRYTPPGNVIGMQVP